MPNEVTHLQILTGPPPATLQEDDPGVVLATVPIRSVRLGADKNGLRITLDISSQVEVEEDGIAEHFRVVIHSGECALLGHVSDTYGTGNLRLSDTKLMAGGSIFMWSFEFVAPGIMKPEAPVSREEEFDDDDF